MWPALFGLRVRYRPLIQLLRWFNYDPNVTSTSYYELRTDPVARALYEIGTPAEPALKEALESKDIETRIRVVNILVLTNTLESRVILRQHIEKEPNPQLKKSIQHNLSRLENTNIPKMGIPQNKFSKNGKIIESENVAIRTTLKPQICT